MAIVRCSGRHPDFIKRVIKRVNVERGNVGSKQRSDEQRSLKRLQTDRMLNFIKRVTNSATNAIQPLLSVQNLILALL